MNDEVSDPSDWLDTPLASLMQLEQSLRCHVCKDFYDSPVITSCCHTFCSLCIRRALNTDGKCPMCRATDQESKLRGNWAIRDAVDAFNKSRNVMLDLSRRPAVDDSADPAVMRKRKVSGESVYAESNKRTRMSTRSSSARAVATTAGMIQEEMNDAPEVEEVVEVPPPNDGLVECPICLWRMKLTKINTHLDSDECPGEPIPQPNLPKPRQVDFATPRMALKQPTTNIERLPSTNYSILNETKLRKKLSDLGIPNWGPRLLMEKRHREWVMIWNANCDSALPKTKRQLLQDLDTWERTQGGQASTISLAANLGAQIKDKEFDTAGWSAKHNSEFQDLIAQARKSVKRNQHSPVGDESRSAQGSSSGEPRVDGAGPSHIAMAERKEDPPPDIPPTLTGSIAHTAVVDLRPPTKPEDGGEKTS